MENNCIICFEHLCIPMFIQDTTNLTIENDCTRLICGHGFHTKCIINSLQTARGCPLCRMVDTEDPLTYHRRRLEMQRCCHKIMEDIKKETLVEHIKDYRSFVNELEEKRKNFKKRVEEFKAHLRAEYKIEEIINYITKLKKNTRKEFRKEVKKRGGIYTIAIKHYSERLEDEFLFGEKSPWYFSMKNSRDFW
jgi:Zinc finger, C3HC4 type (RING finger)